MRPHRRPARHQNKNRLVGRHRRVVDRSDTKCIELVSVNVVAQYLDLKQNITIEFVTGTKFLRRFPTIDLLLRHVNTISKERKVRSLRTCFTNESALTEDTALLDLL